MLRCSLTVVHFHFQYEFHFQFQFRCCWPDKRDKVVRARPNMLEIMMVEAIPLGGTHLEQMRPYAGSVLQLLRRRRFFITGRGRGLRQNFLFARHPLSLFHRLCVRVGLLWLVIVDGEMPLQLCWPLPLPKTGFPPTLAPQQQQQQQNKPNYVVKCTPPAVRAAQCCQMKI